jgi:hypothetical protein
MALKIFGNDPETQQAPRQSFKDDVVGRFRSGHVVNKAPVALNEWRITTGDPEVADAVFDFFGGDAPQQWDTDKEDNLEVFTASKEVAIILEGPKALRQKMVLWGRQGKPLMVSDGAVIDYPDDQKGQPDPDADLTFAERKAKARDGFGSEPQTEIYFRLAENPDLGLFKFQSASWSLVSDLAYNDVEQEIADYAADSETGRVKATLALEEVSFVAKNGPRAGKTVQYTKPVLKIQGAA